MVLCQFLMELFTVLMEKSEKRNRNNVKTGKIDVNGNVFVLNFFFGGLRSLLFHRNYHELSMNYYLWFIREIRNPLLFFFYGVWEFF